MSNKRKLILGLIMSFCCSGLLLEGCLILAAHYFPDGYKYLFDIFMIILGIIKILMIIFCIWIFCATYTDKKIRNKMIIVTSLIIPCLMYAFWFLALLIHLILAYKY